MIQETKDAELILSILAQCWDEFSPDYTIEEFRPHMFKAKGRYLLSSGGLFVCFEHEGVLEAHPAFPPDKRGAKAVAAGLELIQWAKGKHKGLLCNICSHRAEVRRYARLCGLRPIFKDAKFIYYGIEL